MLLQISGVLQAECFWTGVYSTSVVQVQPCYTTARQYQTYCRVKCVKGEQKRENVLQVQPYLQVSRAAAVVLQTQRHTSSARECKCTASLHVITPDCRAVPIVLHYADAGVHIWNQR
jgi:hypothetical protein